LKNALKSREVVSRPISLQCSNLFRRDVMLSAWRAYIPLINSALVIVPYSRHSHFHTMIKIEISETGSIPKSLQNRVRPSTPIYLDSSLAYEAKKASSAELSGAAGFVGARRVPVVPAARLRRVVVVVPRFGSAGFFAAARSDLLIFLYRTKSDFGNKGASQFKANQNGKLLQTACSSKTTRSLTSNRPSSRTRPKSPNI
jgi:hypothetical protein